MPEDPASLLPELHEIFAEKREALENTPYSEAVRNQIFATAANDPRAFTWAPYHFFTCSCRGYRLWSRVG